MFAGLGMWEVLLIFLVVLLLFGAKRLPEIGSSLGKGIREFKGSLRELEGELKVPEDRERSGRRRDAPSGLSDDDSGDARGNAPPDADAPSRDRPRRLRAETLAPEAAAPQTLDPARERRDMESTPAERPAQPPAQPAGRDPESAEGPEEESPAGPGRTPRRGGDQASDE